MESVLSISEGERIGSLEIWIDPTKMVKEGSECGTWLPSPVKSILAPRKSLHLLSARRRCLLRNPSCNSPLGVSSSAIMDSALEAEEVHSHGSSEVAFLRLSTLGESKSKCMPPGTDRDCFEVCISEEYSRPSTSLMRLQNFSPKRLWQKHYLCPNNLCSFPERSESSSDSTVSDEGPVSSYLPIKESFRKPDCFSHNRSLQFLFCSSSPLSSCEIRELISFEKFQAMSVTSQEVVISQLPSMDHNAVSNDSRMMDSALHNEYVGAALRDWQDRMALGMLRKQCNQTQVSPPLWKQHMFENYWGEPQQSEKTMNCNDSLPYYPTHSYSQEHRSALQAIVLPLSLCAKQHLSPVVGQHSISHPRCTLQPTARKVSVNICGLSRSNKQVAIRNKGVVKRLPTAGKMKRIKKRKTKLFSLHPVFQDHFSTLHSDHVPQRFLDSVSSIGTRTTPLRVCIPVSVYRHHLQGRSVDQEHSYYGSRKGHGAGLPVSVTSSCSCRTTALSMCISCQRFYHPTCGEEITSGRCPACSKLQ